MKINISVFSSRYATPALPFDFQPRGTKLNWSMKTFFALLVGIAIGVGIWWYYSNNRSRSDVRADIQTDVKSAGDKIETAAKSAGDKIQEKLREWKLQPDDIKD